MLSCWVYGSFNLRKHHKEFSKKKVRLLKVSNKTLITFTVCGSWIRSFYGVVILMSSEPSSTGWRSIGLLYSDSHICLSLGTGVRRPWLRRWPVRCRMAPLSRGSIRPAGGLRDAMEEGGFIINTHSLGVYIILGSSLCSLCSKCNGIFLFSGHVLIGHSSKNIPKTIKCCMCKVIIS